MGSLRLSDLMDEEKERSGVKTQTCTHERYKKAPIKGKGERRTMIESSVVASDEGSGVTVNLRTPWFSIK